jgi:GAF domain-containing protein
MTTHPTPTDSRAGLAEVFTDLGRELAGRRSIDDVFRTITNRAFETVPSAEHAAISRGRGGAFETVAATSDLPLQVDEIQYQLNSGPCVDAILENTVFRVGNLERDRAWPEFGSRAAEQYGIHSMLSVRLFLEDDDLMAGLNLYSSATDAFDESDQTVATLLATHGALAVTSARRQDKIDNLERALNTSRRIGIAMGILMAAHKVTDDQAFDLLRIASQAQHRKLFDIAEDVAVTGTLDLPKPPVNRHR